MERSIKFILTELMRLSNPLIIDNFSFIGSARGPSESITDARPGIIYSREIHEQFKANISVNYVEIFTYC